MEKRNVLSLGCAFAIALAASTSASAAWIQTDSWRAGDYDTMPGNANFGYAVALNDDLALVGARTSHNDSGIASGAVYLYNISDPFNATGEVKLLADDLGAGDNFGDAIALGGGYAVVGARTQSGNAGAVYIFDTTTGAQLHKLTVGGSNQFGNDVAISGNIVLVGNRVNDTVYLYDAATGSQYSGFSGNDTGDDNFGWTVSISGETAIVGAINSGDGGAAYLFDISDPTNPVQMSKLQPDDLPAGGRYGEDVAVYGDVAVVGSRNNAVHLYNIADRENPVLIATLHDDAVNSATYGYTVSTDGQVVLVSDDRAGDATSGSIGTGAVWVYDATDGSLIDMLTPDDGADNDRFGWGLSVADGRALVGAWGFDDPGFTSGKVYLFAVPEPTSLALLAAGSLLFIRRR